MPVATVKDTSRLRQAFDDHERARLALVVAASLWSKFPEDPEVQARLHAAVEAEASACDVALALYALVYPKVIAAEA